jgi:hypothetical protein
MGIPFKVSILFARSDSIYKSFAECDVFDAERDARTFAGGMPIVAHPPCRSWGRLRGLAHIIEEERQLGPWAAAQVRAWGGVLEHPQGSKLWDAAGLPEPGESDRWNGFTLLVEQFWWGHRGGKPTWLYFAGIQREQLPSIPWVGGRPTHVICSSSLRGKWRRPEVSRPERDGTPLRLARWLVKAASSASIPCLQTGNTDFRNCFAFEPEGA